MFFQFSVFGLEKAFDIPLASSQEFEQLALASL